MNETGKAAQLGLFGELYAPSGPRKPPSESREAKAARTAKRVAEGNDLGELPPVQDEARRARTSASLVEFAREYCIGLLLAREPSPRLVAYAERLQAAVEGAGLTHIRFPRGAGKTTWIKALIAWGTATGRLRFPVVFCASMPLASALLADVWSVFENSDAFAADFPEVSYPIRALAGNAQRAGAQNIGGVRTQIVKRAGEIHLPTVEGAASSGAVIRARGAGGAARGMVAGANRPDFILLDDIQTRKDAESDSRTDKLERWITQDVMGLGGAKLASAAMTSTPIRRGDLSERFADEAAHPEWKLEETPLVVSWPNREDLWEHYDELYRAGVREGDAAFSAATAFYEAHRAEMDDGGEVIDPGAFDARLEISGLQHARNLLITQGREAFDAEYQLVTKAAQTAIVVPAALVRSRLTGCDRFALPPGTVRVFGFLDVNAAAGISHACVASGPRRVAAVVDYGRYPGDGRRLVERDVPLDRLQAEVARGVAHVLDRMLLLRFVTARGAAHRLDAVWVDIGYLQNTVLAVADGRQRVSGRIVRGCKGYSNVHFLAGASGKHVLTRAEGVDEREWDNRRWMAQNSDVWKETAQRAFLAEPGAPGSLALFGNDPRVHAEYADEITAETLDEKLDSKRGAVYRWTLRPGAANHYLDCTGGCFAMASWYRAYETDEMAARSATMPARGAPAIRPRRTVAAVRRAAASIIL